MDEDLDTYMQQNYVKHRFFICRLLAGHRPGGRSPRKGFIPGGS